MQQNVRLLNAFYHVATAPSRLFSHGPQTPQDVNRQTPISKTEFGVRQIRTATFWAYRPRPNRQVVLVFLAAQGRCS